MRKHELLSPAGNFEKLKAAILYGADAVYLAGNSFGMRSAADNFTRDELKEACDFVHTRGKKLYVTVNTMPREDEYPALRDYLTAIRDFGIDAYIVADIGVMTLLREVNPSAVLHISTQANTVSSASARAWMALGASRVVLARELSLTEIREIRRNIPKELELEAFIHGSMCISYSGRCLLSNHMIGRDGNRGMCAQPCRWNYTIYEEKRPNMPIPVEEDARGTFIMSSKDLCMIDHVPELMESGIDSFKIEGRMKSAYYTAVVTNAYRMAMDAYEKNPAAYEFNTRLLSEVESVSHREYATGYYFDVSQENAQTVTDMGYLREKAYLATAVSYDAQTQLATFVQRNKLLAGSTVELISPGKIGRSFTADILYDENGNQIESTPHPFMKFMLRVPFEVREGDILRA